MLLDAGAFNALEVLLAMLVWENTTLEEKMRKTTGLRRVYFATKFSVQGIQACWRSEPSFRFELLLLCGFAPASFWLAQNPFQWAVLVAPLLCVLSAEMINTAIERVIDHMTMDHHQALGEAKDLGSAAVFMCMIMTLLVWGAMLIHNWADIFPTGLFAGN